MDLPITLSVYFLFRLTFLVELGKISKPNIIMTDDLCRYIRCSREVNVLAMISSLVCFLAFLLEIILERVMAQQHFLVATKER